MITVVVYNRAMDRQVKSGKSPLQLISASAIAHLYAECDAASSKKQEMITLFEKKNTM